MPEALYQPFPLPGAARGHIWHHAPATRRPRHFHSEPELNLIAAGSARFGVGDLTMSVAAGDLLWWSPGQDHVLLDASPDFDLFVIGVTPELSARALDTNRQPVHATRVRLEPAAFEAFRSFCAAPAANDPAAVERHIGEFWRRAHQARSSTTDKHALTVRSLMWVTERPELRRSQVAAAVRGHPTEVSRHFHRDLGLTLTEYRTRLRLLRFIRLAKSGEANLLLAALEAGFGSYSQCHRAFQQTLGCGPRRYFQAEVCSKLENAFLPFAR